MVGRLHTLERTLGNTLPESTLVEMEHEVSEVGFNLPIAPEPGQLTFHSHHVDHHQVKPTP